MTYECQIYSLEEMYIGKPLMVPQPLDRRIKLAISKRLDPRLKKTLRQHWIRLHQKVSSPAGRQEAVVVAAPTRSDTGFQPGDLIRVRSQAEIEATLDPWRKLKGCRLMPEMLPYCDTTQRILKPMTRFLDECSYSIRKCKGLVLLEGVMCEGVAESGPCDRSCFYFWREEWLEKLDDQSDTVAPQ